MMQCTVEVISEALIVPYTLILEHTPDYKAQRMVSTLFRRRAGHQCFGRIIVCVLRNSTLAAFEAIAVTALIQELVIMNSEIVKIPALMIVCCPRSQTTHNTFRRSLTHFTALWRTHSMFHPNMRLPPIPLPNQLSNQSRENRTPVTTCPWLGRSALASDSQVLQRPCVD